MLYRRYLRTLRQIPHLSFQDYIVDIPQWDKLQPTIANTEYERRSLVKEMTSILDNISTNRIGDSQAEDALLKVKRIHDRILRLDVIPEDIMRSEHNAALCFKRFLQAKDADTKIRSNISEVLYQTRNVPISKRNPGDISFSSKDSKRIVDFLVRNILLGFDDKFIVSELKSLDVNVIRYRYDLVHYDIIPLSETTDRERRDILCDFDSINANLIQSLKK